MGPMGFISQEKLGKYKEMESTLESPERNSALMILYFSLVKLVLGF
jgi:hypothetical protein